jgi:type IV secretion system protein VirB8
MRSSSRIAWIIAGAAGLIAVLEAIALVMLTPLKTVQPYTLMVDRTTGYVQALKPLEQSTIAPDAALTQSFLVQYVIGRESFDIATLNANYRKIALLSADSARTSYVQLMQLSNPESPLIRYPRTSVVEARVKSVSPIGTNAALVRFDAIRTDANGQAQPGTAWVAVIKYRFSNAPMSVDDRFVNPLGFQVTSYRKDPEALPPATAEQQSATPTVLPVQVPATAPSNPYYSGVPNIARQGSAR